MPQSQTAAKSWHQEEMKRDKTYTHKTNKQMFEKHKNQSLFPKRGDQNAKTNGKTRTKNMRTFKH